METLKKQIGVSPSPDLQDKEQEMVELKKLQKRLGLNADWYRSILETARDAIISVDHEGTLLTCNRAGQQLFGYGAEELIGRDASMLFPKPDQPEGHQYLDRFLCSHPEGSIEEHSEALGLRKDGSLFPLDSIVGRMSFEGETICTAILRDITWLKKIEAERNLAHEQIKQILDTAADGMRIINGDFVVIQANQTFASLAGLDLKEVIGKKCYESFPGAACDTQGCPVTQIFRGVEHIECEVVKKRMDESEVPCLLSANPYLSETGEILGVIEDVRDITAIKANAVALREAGEEVAKASQVKSLFIANMSHELRTPLNNIQGMTYLLENSPLNPEQQKQLASVIGSTTSLQTMINDILDFSSLDRGELRLKPESFNLMELQDTLTTIFSEQCRQKGLQYSSVIVSEVPVSLFGDSGRLQQVLSHLLANAVKFSNSGDIVLTITVSCAQGRKITLLFTVKDSGQGMDAEEQRLALEFFRQVDGSSTRSQGGVGLGLSLVQKLIDIMGGVLHIDSQAGRGSTFSFTADFARSAGGIKAATAVQGHPPAAQLPEQREQKEPIVSTRQPDPALLARLFPELAKLLQKNDPSARTIFSQIKDKAEMMGQEEDFVQLGQLISRYDFEAALDALSRLAKQQNVSIGTPL